MKKSRIFNNVKWIVICRMIQSLLQLVIGMLSARYLGPANYGLIGYAGAIVAFALPLMQLGLQSTLIQELIETPEQEGEIMGTALFLELLSSLICIGFIYKFVSIVNHGEIETLIVCVLYSFTLLFRSLELMQCWFQYKLVAKYPSIVMLCSYIVVSIYKIYILATAKNIYWFAVVNSIDYAIIGISLVFIYYKLGAQKFSFSGEMAKRLLLKSKYYILAAMMVTVFQNTDHIMLKMFSGDIENGYYTAAVTCAGVCQFVYSAIIDSIRPVILTFKKNDEMQYKKSISKLYCIIIYLALAQSIVFTIFAKLIVNVLYGENYAAAIPVFQIIVWYIVFSYMGSVRNIWILAEGKQSIIWKLNLSGAVLNVIINAILIPKWGACGAAVASLVTQIFTNFVLCFLIDSLKEHSKLLLNGLHPKSIKDLLKEKLL